MDPKKRYERRIYHFSNLLVKQIQRIKYLGMLRLLIFIGGGLLTILLYATNNDYLALGILIAFVVVFVLTVIKYTDLNKRKDYTSTLLKINEASVKRVMGEWKDFVDTGEEFVNSKHPYSEDLDLFGKGSLFQWTNVSRTFNGRLQFAKRLIEPPKDSKLIIRTQEAILELAKKLEWRQRFQVEGEVITTKEKDPTKLFEWANEKYPFYDQKGIIAIIWIMPIVTISLILMYLLIPQIIALYLPLAGVLLQIILLKFRNKERTIILEGVSRYRNTISLYENMIQLFEQETFQTPLILEVQDSLKTSSKQTASKQLNRLGKLVDSISNRSHMFYILFDILLLWDYHMMNALEKWKKASGHLVKNWVEAIAQMEALSSLAQIQYDNPGWVMPTIKDNELGFTGRDLGHPLLNEQRKTNSFELGSSEVLLITGSNMSGKSTLLRTVGINLVLAYTGAPVCASQMICARMDIYTCMRVRDNLEQSISSFYAELLRIKAIVTATKQKQRVLFLLDEIFKGTNSQDRHIGARVLIKQLHMQGAIGFVSTHDLELTDLEKEMTGVVKNYYFREYYKDNQIYFDYILREGVSNTKNALYLIKMAGIDVDEYI